MNRPVLLLALSLLGLLGLRLLFHHPVPGRESLGRQQAVAGLAPAGNIGQGSESHAIEREEPIAPVVVKLSDLPAHVYDANNQFDRWQRGEIDLDEQDGIRSAEEVAFMREAALRLAPSQKIQRAENGPAMAAPSAGIGWDSIDYTECCGGGGNVPPDPELAVGPNHAIAVVNAAFEIYDKNGNSLYGPTTFASLAGHNPNCAGAFDPNALYDESADRYIMGIDAGGTHYCLAISRSGDPLGDWAIYAFPTGSERDFFDYPHAGVGNEAIYMGANIFRCSFFCSFKESRIWAFDKSAMYAGAPAAFATRSLGNHDTPQPLHLHGYAQGSWPVGGPHYILTETGYDGAHYTVFVWDDPFGANELTSAGTMNLVAETEVIAGMPVHVPQKDGQELQANDYRPQDFEYRNGYAWSVQTIACNPGGGTVDCIRWTQIDPATATVIDGGVYASGGEYRFVGDLAVNHCGDMAVGYTKSSASIYPSIWVSGRLNGDPAGTLQAETQLKAGETVYTAFDSAPHRWGDYTEMTIDPDGETFWYLGQYSKETGTSYGRWGTYVGSFSFGCTGSIPPDPGATPDSHSQSLPIIVNQ